MEQKLYRKIVKLIPSDDLKASLTKKNFRLGEKDLLKIIEEYARNYDEKISLLREASLFFEEKLIKEQAKKLIEYHEKQKEEFLSLSDDAVYVIRIGDEGIIGDNDDLFTAKTFEDALSLIKSYLKCYKDVGAKDCEFSRYEIRKVTTTVPDKPSDLYRGKAGVIGTCFLGYRLRILNVYMNGFYNEFGCKRKSCANCKRECIDLHEIRVPAFLEQYSLIAYCEDPYRNPRKLTYGVTAFEMNDGDDDSYVILLDGESVKKRNATAKDKDGYHYLFYDHDHPEYPKVFKPKREDVPIEVYEDYLYAVQSLKEIAQE